MFTNDHNNWFQWFKNVISKYTPPLNKRRIGNAKNLINAAAFNRKNTVRI